MTDRRTGRDKSADRKITTIKGAICGKIRVLKKRDTGA